ncbi:MAG: phosphate acyltransferase PlsX, partial [Bdellovibrionia bacterium]
TLTQKHNHTINNDDILVYNAPQSNLMGAIEALPDLDSLPPGSCDLVLVGDENIIRPLLEKRPYQPLAQALKEGTSRKGCRVSLRHAPETIDMEDSIRAIRRKPNASINVGCQLAAESYEQSKKAGSPPPAAFISAGHSGAMMTSALLTMGRLKDVERPAIAVKLPTISRDGCVLIDVGANVDCKPEHLRDFAIMGAAFASVERHNPALPRVGVLSNGEERSKGNELTRAAAELIDKLPCLKPENPQAIGQFVGYAEGKEIFKGQVDVVVTDGFVGNVVLKSVEGLGSAVVTLMKQEGKKNFLNILGFLFSAGAFRRLKKKLDYAETGAAPLLGVAGYAFVCHGRSNSRAIKNALLRASTAVQERLIERLEDALATVDAPVGLRAQHSTGATGTTGASGASSASSSGPAR